MPSATTETRMWASRRSEPVLFPNAMRPNEFVVESFVGALPLKFSMTQSEVESILGPADVASRNWKNEPSWTYHAPPELSLGFDLTTALLSHIGVGKTSGLTFAGIDLFNDPGALSVLLRKHRAFLWVGFVVFNEIGLAFADWGEKGWDRTAIVVFPEGSWDRAKDKGKPFSIADLEGAQS